VEELLVQLEIVRVQPLQLLQLLVLPVELLILY
jgi:hypothetical protein